MRNNVLALALVISLLALAPIPDPGHPAQEIGPGTFAPGDFVFPDQLSVTGNFVVDTNALFVDNGTGRVGIGLTNPGQKLHVDGNGLFDGQLIVDGGVGTGSFGTLQVRQQGDTANDGIALTSSHGTAHRIWKDSSGRFNIGTSGSPSQVVITTGGNVGIGTTSPNARLEVVGDARIGTAGAYQDIIIETRAGFTDGAVQIRPATTPGSGIGNQYLIIAPSTTTGTTKHHLIIEDGDVGIGTTNPDAKLHVNGTAMLSEQLIIGGSINHTGSGTVRTFANGCEEIANTTGVFLIC